MITAIRSTISLFRVIRHRVETGAWCSHSGPSERLYSYRTTWGGIEVAHACRSCGKVSVSYECPA